MPIGPGGLDSNGIWQFGEDDSEALASDLLNLGMGSVSTALSTLGGVLQVVSVTKTNFFSSTAAGWVDVTGLTATITPVSESSKIVVMVDVFLGATNFIAQNVYWKMLRGSTDIGVGTDGSLNNISGGGNFSAVVSVPFMGGTSKTHMDSPATTSATTYKVQINKYVAGGTMYINRRGSTTNTCGISTVTLMEVAG